MNQWPVIAVDRTFLPLPNASTVYRSGHGIAGFVANADRADLVRCIVTRRRPALFRGRHFEDVIILLCVRWYLRYSLTYRDQEEIMLERNLSVDHVTIWRWVQRYAPVLNQADSPRDAASESVLAGR